MCTELFSARVTGVGRKHGSRNTCWRSIQMTRRMMLSVCLLCLGLMLTMTASSGCDVFCQFMGQLPWCSGEEDLCEGVTCDTGFECDPATGECASTGACCASDGTCSVTIESACTGTYQGDGTTCDPNPCDPPAATGACCAADGSCSVTTEADCAGTYQGDDTNCDPNPCDPPAATGACCAADSSCSVTTEAACDGTYQGDDTSCDPDPC